MKQHNKKLSVLYELGQESEPIDLHTLLKKLGRGFSERSVRRWLLKMSCEGMVEKIGNKRGTKYRVLAKQDRQIHGCFSPKSIKILAEISHPIYERIPTIYQEDWLNSYEPNKTFYIPQNLRKKLFNAGKRFINKNPAGTYARQIFNHLLIDLSYNSSRLEGNTYSLIDTQKLIFEGISAEGKLTEEKVMILNHKESIRYLIETSTQLELNKETICTLHYLLSDGLIDPKEAGKIRNHSIRIMGSTYIPFSYQKKLEMGLENIVEKASKIHDPFEQSLFLLVHISYLQAFADVNKRTARLSANIPLIKNNLVPLSFNDIEKDDYISAMIAIYELQDIHPILDLYTFSYMRTCAIYDAKVKSMGFDEIRVRYRQERRSIVRYIILHQLSKKPMEAYILTQTENVISSQDRQDFIEDVKEDLKEIDENYILGLGLTKEQLHIWKTLVNKSLSS